MLTDRELTECLLTHEAGHLIMGALEGASALVARPDGPTGAVAQALVLPTMDVLETLPVVAGGPAATCMLDPRLREGRIKWLMDPAAGIAAAAGWGICKSDAARLKDWSDNQTATEFRRGAIASLLLREFIEGWTLDNAAAFDDGAIIPMDPATVRAALAASHLLGLADVEEVWLDSTSVANIIAGAVSSRERPDHGSIRP